MTPEERAERMMDELSKEVMWGGTTLKRDIKTRVAAAIRAAVAEAQQPEKSLGQIGAEGALAYSQEIHGNKGRPWSDYSPVEQELAWAGARAVEKEVRRRCMKEACRIIWDAGISDPCKENLCESLKAIGEG